MPTTARPDPRSGKVAPSDAGGAPGSPVYAMGALSFDFGTRERRDALTAANGGQPIITNADLNNYLTLVSPSSTADFDAILWTLTIDGEPVYAIRADVHARPLGSWSMMQTVLAVLADPSIERIAVPGFLAGTATLLNGRVVPVIDPDVQAIQTWSSQSIALAVGLAGTMALSSPTVDLTQEGTADWVTWNSSNVLVQNSAPGSDIGALTVLGVGGAGLITPYTGSTITCTWNNGSPGPNPSSSNSGVAVSAIGGGLQFTVPADTSPRTLRIYARTFACKGELSASLADGSAATYVDASFSAFPPVAGLPGVVDGVYTIVYQAPASTTLTIQLTGTPWAAASAHPRSVILYRDLAPSGPTQALGVGMWPASTLSDTVVENNLSSAFVPEGLRLTVFTADEFAGLGAAIPATAPGLPATTLPGGFDNVTKSLIIEPENYVGIQAVTLKLAPPMLSPLVDAILSQDFMDRVYLLLRNAGATSAERAVNYVATQASKNKVLADALASGLVLESVTAEPSAFTRPGSDCWDVKLTFFSPLQVTQASRRIVRATVDVVNVRPVLISAPRIWTQY
jgi:hypothetical protein